MTNPDRDSSDGWVEAPADEAGDAIIAAMALGGVEYLFFTSGSEIMFYQEAVAKAKAHGRKAPKLVTMTHECASLNAALGYAAVTGMPAATAAHVDVGTQHYGSAIHTAFHSGLPVLITAGAPPAGYPGSMRGARDGGHFWLQQREDQNGIVRPYMKWDHRLEYQDNPGLIVSRALQVARSEPCGPVYLSLPREIALRSLEGARFPTVDRLGIPLPAAPNPDGIAELAARLAAARNPFVVVSRSGRKPATVPALVALCELLALPVVDSTARAYHCFPMNHPLFQAGASMANADLVLVLEADVPWVPGRASAPPASAYVAVIDVDAIKVKVPTYEFPADMRMAADSLLSLQALLDAAKKMMAAGDPRIDRRAIEERRELLTNASQARMAKAKQDAMRVAENSPIDPLWLSYQIGELLDDNCLVIDDTLSHNPMYHYLRCERPASYFRNPASAGGWAPGAALGAKLGRPERDVVALTGDGFYMYASPNAAIWAAVHYGAPFMTVIYQNRGYSTGTSATASYYPDGYAVKGGLEGGYFDPPVDFAREAEAAGAYGENVRDPGEVAAALRRGLEQVRAGKPAVISVWLARMIDGK